jgi:hypothetical protein
VSKCPHLAATVAPILWSEVGIGVAVAADPDLADAQKLAAHFAHHGIS